MYMHALSGPRLSGVTAARDLLLLLLEWTAMPPFPSGPLVVSPLCFPSSVLCAPVSAVS